MTKVLLIDDSQLVLAWTSAKLSEHGFEVTTYDRALGIQMFVRKNKPDIILLDVNMPALNGDMVCKMLKSSPATSDVIVALYSGIDEDELKTLVSQAGADGYVQKSEDGDALAQQIRTLLAGSGRDG